MTVPSRARYINGKLIVSEYAEVEPIVVARAIDTAQKGKYEHNTNRDIEEKPVLSPETQNA